MAPAPSTTTQPPAESAALMALPPGIPYPADDSSFIHSGLGTVRDDLTEQELDGAQVHIYLLFYEDHALLWSTLEQVFVRWDEKRMNRALGYLEEIDAVAINPAPSPNPWTPDDALVSVVPNDPPTPPFSANPGPKDQLNLSAINSRLPLPWPGSHIHSPQFPQTPGPVSFGFQSLVPSSVGDVTPEEEVDSYFPVVGAKSRSAKTPMVGGRKTPRQGSIFGGFSMTRLQESSSQPSTGTGGSMSHAEWEHTYSFKPSPIIGAPASPAPAPSSRLITSEGITNPSISRTHSFAPMIYGSSSNLFAMNNQMHHHGYGGHGHHAGAVTPPQTDTPTHTGLASEVTSAGVTPELRPVMNGLGLSGKVEVKEEPFSLDASRAGQVWSGDDRGGGYY